MELDGDGKAERVVADCTDLVRAAEAVDAVLAPGVSRGEQRPQESKKPARELFAFWGATTYNEKSFAL